MRAIDAGLGAGPGADHAARDRAPISSNGTDDAGEVDLTDLGGTLRPLCPRLGAAEADRAP